MCLAVTIKRGGEKKNHQISKILAFFKNIGILLWMLTLKKEFLQKKINKKEVAFKLTACSMFKAHFFVVDNREIKLIIK